MLRALDRDKDQSYFLFGVRPEVFAKVLFPLGDKTKDEVRAIARRAGLPNADKPDSQQICFIPDGDHRRYVEAHGGAGLPGAIVDEAGADAGRPRRDPPLHRRAAARRAGGGRRAALRRAHRRRHRQGRRRAARQPRALGAARLRRALDARRVHRGRGRCVARSRSATTPQALPAWIAAPAGDAPGAVTVELDSPADGVAPGQAAVFYDGEAVLGGGWID